VDPRHLQGEGTSPTEKAKKSFKKTDAIQDSYKCYKSEFVGFPPPSTDPSDAPGVGSEWNKKRPLRGRRINLGFGQEGTRGYHPLQLPRRGHKEHFRHSSGALHSGRQIAAAWPNATVAGVTQPKPPKKL
jgi:hypothetical protein